ncbi:Protein doublesex [Ooceraea biroi]|uniref:Protein doublesex n=1 Tax=Ooceraea biroi TaxID=2015173 RepID=A0A026WXP7_OOCBI|nr:Protein doublesex [Ooceraea biroi]
MNKDEDHGSEAGNSNASSNSQPKKRRQPCCMRCDNHGLVIGLKQHKRYCKYQFCKCPACQLTVERQRVQARQTALKRAIEMDRSKKILPVEVSPFLFFRRLSRSQKVAAAKSHPETEMLSSTNAKCKSTRQPPTFIRGCKLITEQIAVLC